MIYPEYNMPIMFSENDTYCNMSKFRNPRNIIFICGFSGSGKSILAKYLCVAHNATLVSLDHIILWLNLKGKMRTNDIKLFDPIIYKYYTDREILINKLVETCNKNRNSFDYGEKYNIGLY